MKTSSCNWLTLIIGSFRIYLKTIDLNAGPTAWLHVLDAHSESRPVTTADSYWAPPGTEGRRWSNMLKWQQIPLLACVTQNPRGQFADYCSALTSGSERHRCIVGWTCFRLVLGAASELCPQCPSAHMILLSISIRLLLTCQVCIKILNVYHKLQY